ncbi:MAG: thymidine kinase, partial [Planctomycetota bacterium]
SKDGERLPPGGGATGGTMAKLYFRHGTVGSAKTLNLLAVAHNYERQGKRIEVFKPRFDTRFGAEEVASRAGLSRTAHRLLDENTDLDPEEFLDCHCILVDEAQFLDPRHVEQLRDISRAARCPVICYGLRTDFRTQLFPGSRRLLELADTIEEVKTTCAFCNKKALLNLRHVDGVASLAGPSAQLGTEELFIPVCFAHYLAEHDRAGVTGMLEELGRESAPEALPSE